MAGACGGDIVGTWKVTSSCVELEGPLGDADCPTATLEASIQVTGTATYTSAMTYTLDLTLQGTETILLPATCLHATCEQVNQMFQVTPPDAFTTIRCTSAAGGACSCAGALIPMPVPETGIYTTSGKSLTSTPSDGSGADTDQYCVMGKRLDILLGPTSVDPALIASGGFTLMKQ